MDAVSEVEEVVVEVLYPFGPLQLYDDIVPAPVVAPAVNVIVLPVHNGDGVAVILA